MPKIQEEVELELKEKIKAFPADSIIRNLFLCELVPGLGPGFVFRGATITKEGAEYLNKNDKCVLNMCGYRWWAINAEEDLSDLEEWLEEIFVKEGTRRAVSPDFLHRWRQ